MTDQKSQAPHPLGPYVRLFVQIEDREISTLLWAFAANFCLLGAWYAIRPLRETFGVRPEAELASLFGGTFFSSLVFLPIYLWLVTKFGRRLLAPIFFHGCAACVFAFWLLFTTMSEQSADTVGSVFFVWASTYVLFAGSLLWSILVDLHKSGDAKRLFGLIFAGGTAGGLLSSFAVRALVEQVGTTHLFWIPIVLFELIVLCVSRFDVASRTRFGAATSETEDKTAPVGGNILEGLRHVMRSPYLAGICLYMFFATFAGTVLYFEQQAIVGAAIEEREARTKLYADMNLWTQALTVVGQALITAPLIRRVGLVVALIALPLLYVVGLSALSFATVLPMLVVFQVVRRSIGFAIAKPSKEILFTVVGRDAKYKSKGFIDTVVYRGGDAVSGQAFVALKGLGFTLSHIALATIPVCLAWAVLCARLGRKQEALEQQEDLTREFA